MLKKILLCVLSVCIFSNADAGLISKSVKGAIIVKGAKVVAKQAAKNLLKMELKTQQNPC